MAVALTLTKEFLAEAIRAKKTPLYANQDSYRGRSYEKEIFPQARLQFKEYDKLYPTNEEFTEYFVRDLYRKDSQLVKTLGEKTAEKILAGQSVEGTEEVLYQEVPTQAETTATQIPTGEPTSTMTGGGYLPSIPRAPVIHTIPQTKPTVTKALIKEAVPGLKTTPETGLDYEGKPYQVEATGPIKTAGKNLASDAQMGVKKGLTRAGGGFRNILGGIGKGGMGILGGIGQGGVRFVGGAGGFFSNIGTQLSRGSFIKGPPVKFWLIFLGAFLLVGTLTAFAPPTGTTPASPAPTPITTPVASCPIIAGKITYPSYQADPVKGHCTSGSAEDVCPTSCFFTSRRSKSIDVDTSGGKDVILPRVTNRIVQWKFIQVLCAGGGIYPNCLSAKGGTGGLYTFEGTIAGETDKWYIQFVHMQIPSLLELNKTYPSGTLVGKTDINIVHTTIGKNIKNPYGSGSVETDCDPGWLPSDFMCQ